MYEVQSQVPEAQCCKATHELPLLKTKFTHLSMLR